MTRRLSGLRRARWRDAGLRERIREHEEVIYRTRDATDPESLQKRALALWHVAGEMKEHRRFADAERYYADADPLLWRFEPLRRWAVAGRRSRALALISLGRFEEAHETLASLIEKIGIRATVPEDPDLMVESLRVWLLLLGQHRSAEEMDAGARAVIEAFGTSTRPTQRSLVSDAFLKRGVAAAMRGDWEAALPIFEEAIARSNADDRGSVLVRAQSMADRAAVLAELGRTHDALAACDEFLEQFGPVPVSDVEKPFAEARQLKDALTASQNSSSAAG
jgi:tetratricopeptide (TPR) repeat protein